jgi:excisionase family DNA binding protein
MSHSSVNNTAADRLLYPPEEAARRLGISRRTLYQLLRDGKLRSVRVEKRARRIPNSALLEYVDALISAEANR